MKTMICKQLGGACDKEFHAETFEEMGEMSKKHAMEMAAKGEQEHIKVMEAMKQHMDDPEAIKQFMEKFQNDFASQPEDE